ncbi:MAG: ABC transporter permease [Acidimicrobiia bacterium]|nr:MAG: ABC transporter permease [Acidimicrobiia bacterium]
MRRRFVVEQRLIDSTRKRTSILGWSIVIGLLVGSVPIILSGVNPFEAYREMLASSTGSQRAIQQTLRATTPLILTGLAAAVAFRMRLYTIGAEGQLYIGAIAGTAMALVIGEGASPWFVMPLVVLAGAAGGAMWALIIAAPRAYFGTDEVVGTLMLNFIALQIMNWLIFGSVSFWRDRENLGFPAGKIVPDSAQLYAFWGRADLGIFIAVAGAFTLWFLIRWTRRGYEWRVIGDSDRAARYAGMNVRRQVIVVLALSGIFAGIAGALQVASVTYALEPRALQAGGVGFTGIVVAAVAGLNPRAIIVSAFVIAAIVMSGPSLSRVGVSPSAVTVLQGSLLLAVAGGQFFNNFRIRAARSIDATPIEAP